MPSANGIPPLESRVSDAMGILASGIYRLKVGQDHHGNIGIAIAAFNNETEVRFSRREGKFFAGLLEARIPEQPLDAQHGLREIVSHVRRFLADAELLKGSSAVVKTKQ